MLTNAGIFGVVVSVTRKRTKSSCEWDEKTETKLQMQLSSVARVLTGRAGRTDEDGKQLGKFTNYDGLKRRIREHFARAASKPKTC